MNATMSLEKIKHYPVMLNQILSIISPQHGGTFIDCTFGGGGYSKAILKFPNTKVIAFDRDKNVQNFANNLSKKFPNRFDFFTEKFSRLNKKLNTEFNPRAIIFDLGVSSFQLEDNKRGFSFKSKNSLGMQMGINEFSAQDAVNKLEVKDLTNIFKILGEEKEGKKIAKKIAIYRSKKNIYTAHELSSIIESAKKNYNKKKINPSTKSFQALRIFVNKEITELIDGLIHATKILQEGGILIVVNFHSIEDRIVKNFFKFYSNWQGNLSRYAPIKLEQKNNTMFDLNIKRAITPSENEIKNNYRSRSAKLRYAIRNKNQFYYPEEFKIKFKKYLDIEEIKL